LCRAFEFSRYDGFRPGFSACGNAPAIDPSQLIPESAQKFRHLIGHPSSGSAMIDLKSFLHKYVQKFAFDVLPSVAATCIGALIVTHYINPKPADRTAAPPAVAAAPADAKPAEKKPAESNAVADRPADDQRPADQPTPREAAAKGKSPAPELRKAVTLTDERRDANELARAALGRLKETEARRPTREARADSKADIRTEPTAESKSVESKHIEVRPAEQKPAVQSAAVTPQLSPVTVLPPAIAVAPTVNAAPAEPPAAESADDNTAGQDRLGRFNRPVPPAEIPASRPPLQLHVEAQAEPQPKETGVVEGVMSVTKSFFRAVTPR